VVKVVGIFCLVYWALPVQDRLGRAASFCFMLLGLYFAFQPVPFLWYYPPAAMLGLLALMRCITVVVTRGNESSVNDPSRSRRANIAFALLSLLTVGNVALFAVSAHAERVWQEEIENNQRITIGRWLKDHGQPTDTVYLEPLGYIGYFSGMRMMD